MLTEIEPCPFCGGDAHPIQDGVLHLVMCDECGARSSELQSPSGDHDAAKRGAIAAWNRRIAAPAPVCQSAGVPTGYALVPIEPTMEMVKAGSTSGGLGMDFHEWMGRIKVAWRHMIAAAPAPVSAPEQPSQDEADLCERIIHAVEGECDGLAITEEQASNILAYLQYGAPMCDMSEAFRIVDNAIGAAEECEPEGGNLRIVTLRIDAARKVRAALAAAPAPVGQSARVPEDIAEGLEILDNFIASVRENGSYSTEATLTFIGQARQCFATAPAPVSAPEARRSGENLMAWAHRLSCGKYAEEQDAIRKALGLEEDCDYGEIIEAIEALQEGEKARGLTRDDLQEKALTHGFQYWRASDAHGVVGTKEQAVELLQGLLGVEVEIKSAEQPSQDEASLCEDGGKCGIGGYCGQCEKVRAASEPEQPSERGEHNFESDKPIPIVTYDDGTCVMLDSWTGGAHEAGVFGEIALRFTDAHGVETVREYVARTSERLERAKGE